MAIKQIKKIKVKTMPHDQPYLQAEKIIEQALESGKTELMLWNMNLTELPDSIKLLDGLKLLNLAGNRFETFPESIKYLTQLQSLDLS